MRSFLKQLPSLGLAFAAAAALASDAPSSPPPAPAERPGPHVKYENPEVDLGEVVRGTVAEAVFVLRSVGSEPLKVVSAHPG